MAFLRNAESAAADIPEEMLQIAGRSASAWADLIMATQA
jgi:hypothetical protein